VRELQGRGVPVRAFVRDPHRAAAALGDQVSVALGDFTDPASIRRALAGMQRVFLCSPNHPHHVEHGTNLIDAAVDAGIRRLVKVSANGAEIGSPLEFWDAHGRIEEHLRTSGLASVVLRPSTYVTNLLASADTVRTLGRLFAPAGDAAVTLIDPRDVAAVAAAVLTEDGHEGRTYTLTGPEAVTYEQVAKTLARRSAVRWSFVDVPDPAARQGMIAAGFRS